MLHQVHAQDMMSMNSNAINVVHGEPFGLFEDQVFCLDLMPLWKLMSGLRSEDLDLVRPWPGRIYWVLVVFVVIIGC